MLSFIIMIVAFIVILGILVLAHELGHFLTAKAFGVRVEEFGIGYPPRIFWTKRGETIYSINLFPIGGFTKLAGEENPEIPDSLASKSPGARLIILGAGALMNALLPVVFFAVAFMVPHNVLSGETFIREALPGSPAALAGMAAGDRVITINGSPVNNLSDVRRHIQINLGREMTVRLLTAGEQTKDVTVIPRWKPPEGQGAIGVKLEFQNPVLQSESLPAWEAVPRSIGQYWEVLLLFVNGIATMIIGATPVAVAGPVAVAQITGEVAQAGLSPLLEFAGFLSLNLAIFNLLPVPALDGGRILFVLIEIVRGKRVSPKIEGIVHLVGFIVLLALILFITFTDILRIVSGGSLLP